MATLDLDACLRRGAVFLWHRYGQLDDPALFQKAKYLIIINAFLPDDALYYLLTTSQVEKLAGVAFGGDVVVIRQGSYEFFGADTAVNVGTAADREPVDAQDFRGMYYDGEISYVGQLSDEDIRRIDAAISSSVRVPKELKRFITAW